MDGLTSTTIGPAANTWQVRWQPVAAPRLRLFCLPHAGGGAVTYRSWAQLLAPDIEVVAIRLPGRENRHRERPHRRLVDIVPELLRDVAPALDRPHAWFGHSLGAIIAYEVARELRRRRWADPVRLLVSGRLAPHLLPRQPPVHAAPTATLMDRIIEMGGTPPEILAEPSMMSGILPTLRADLEVAETYQWRPEDPLGCPISAFGGRADRFANGAELHAWSQHSTSDCDVRMFEGGHFYFTDTPQPLLRAIRASLAEVATPAHSPYPSPTGSHWRQP